MVRYKRVATRGDSNETIKEEVGINCGRPLKSSPVSVQQGALNYTIIKSSQKSI